MVNPKVKVVIFDLDNTLHDAEFLTERVVKQTVEVMIENGLKCNLDEGVDKLKQILESEPNSDKIRKLAINFDSEDEEIIDAGWDAYQHPEFDKLIIFSDAKEVLGKLKERFKLILISQGSLDSQNKRIDTLGIREYFDEIHLPERGKKKERFDEIFANLGLDANQVLVVGDRIDGELKIANGLGMRTCRIMKGKYSILEPRFQDEEPDYTINTLRGLYGVLGVKNDRLKVVAIGGGTGLPTIIEGLRKYTDNLTMVVTVTDSGRSSGILRDELNVLPPGDLRNCLIALSNSDKLMCDLFQHRFDNGSLNGHSFGNLFIAALTQVTGSFEKGVEEASKILKLKGKVLPSTLDNIHICAELEGGQVLEEENNIIDRNNNNVHLRSPIKRVYLKPSARANEKVIQEIEQADLIVLCPGSLYTSLITNLLIEGIPEAIRRSNSKKVYISNIMTQVSQTYGYKASDHVARVKEYLDGDLDFVILNSKTPGAELMESYNRENAYLVENDIDQVENLGVSVISEDLLDNVTEKKLLWEKKDLLRHDPNKIAEGLVGLV